MRKKKILLTGVKTWINLIADNLDSIRAKTIVNRKWNNFSNFKKFKKAFGYKIIHYFWACKNPQELRMFKKLGKKIINYYIGSDVCLEAQKDPENARLCASICDKTICDSPNLQKELASIGIESEVIQNPVPNLVYGNEPFPEENCVLGYVSSINENFYCVDEIEKIASLCPDWKFLIVHHDGTGRKPPPNLEYLGFQNHDDMTRLLNKSRIYLRFTKHDATGKLGLEAMALGRYVVRNMKWDHTVFADSPEKAAREIEKLKNIEELNLPGQNYVKKEWDHKITYGRFRRLYEEI
ncbi:MAG: hypothetical protein ACLFQK_02395 [Fibrobacterota bacterium]